MFIQIIFQTVELLLSLTVFRGMLPSHGKVSYKISSKLVELHAGMHVPEYVSFWRL